MNFAKVDGIEPTVTERIALSVVEGYRSYR